jgi:thiamine-phosphate pyrophosphorylase
MRGLYAIVDTETLARRGVEPLPFLEAMLDARPAAVQLRDKKGGARGTLELLRSMAPLCARAGVPLFANDRPDLALLAGCDGVHLGCDDVPASLARTLVIPRPSPAGRLKIGLSTHTTEDIDAALLEGPDYIAVGPIFATVSKENPSPVVGLERLREHVAHIRGARRALPIVAIGGISLETAASVGALVGCAAVIGALLPEGSGAPSLDAIRARAHALHAVLGGSG